MKGQEIAKSMMNFGKKLADLPHIRRIIEPTMPKEIKSAQKHCISYSEKPSVSSLSSLYELSTGWNETEKSYLRNIEECEQRLGSMELSNTDKEILRDGYAALKQFTKDIGEHLREYGKIHLASVFAEKKVKEFRSYIPSQVDSIYKELHDSEEEKGGVIFYTNKAFEIDFRPNKAKSQFEEDVKRIRTRRGIEDNKLYETTKILIQSEIEKASNAFSEKKLKALHTPILDLEKLKNGELTNSLELYLRVLFAESYDHDSKPIFADDTLFLDEAEKRFFAFFHHHRDSPEVNYINNYRGPDTQDKRISWEIGPQVLFVPEEKKLNVYFVSRGNTALIGNYSV